MADPSSVGFGSAVTASGWDNSLSGQGVTHYDPSGIQLPGASDIGSTLSGWTQDFQNSPLGSVLGTTGTNTPTDFLGSVGSGISNLISNPLKFFGPGGQGDITGQASKLLGGSQSNFWTDLFLRSVVIILGFIFVAVGLTMFNTKGAVTVVNTVKKVGGAAGAL